jgi:ribosomal protein S18 acetylase RimI-like enzyme
MWVAPFARGQGIGDSLVNAVIDWAREQQAGKVALCVTKRSERAMALYRRNGFIDADTQTCVSPGTVNEHKMVRDLSQSSR